MKVVMGSQTKTIWAIKDIKTNKYCRWILAYQHAENSSKLFNTYWEDAPIITTKSLKATQVWFAELKLHWKNQIDMINANLKKYQNQQESLITRMTNNGAPQYSIDKIVRDLESVVRDENEKINDYSRHITSDTVIVEITVTMTTDEVIH